MSLATRACVATYGLAALLTALSARLYQIAVHKHEYYASMARDTYESKATIEARRGSILDVHNTVLARNEPLKIVVVEPLLTTVLATGERRRIVVRTHDGVSV